METNLNWLPFLAPDMEWLTGPDSNEVDIGMSW